MTPRLRFALAAVLLVLGGLGYSQYQKGDSVVMKSSDEALKGINLSTFGERVSSETNPVSPETAQSESITNNNNNETKIMNAKLQTTLGEITIEFLPEQAPETVKNFITLAKSGFYDGTKFHRVIVGFMIQGGDPLTKDDSLAVRWGTGGPGYAFKDEITPNNHNNAGTIAMANSGPNTNGSQFFINVNNNNFLDTKHTVFGRVIAGMDVVSKIEHTATGQQDRPQTPMVIEKVTLSEK